MAEWDSKSGKLRPTWAVSFSPFWNFIGCAVAGIVTALLVFVMFVTGPGLDELNDAVAVAQGGILLLGLTVMVYIIIGPVLAWGVAFSIRHIENFGIHIITFGALGLILGFMLGELLAPGLGAAIAPASGIGAAAGRWVVNPHAKG